MPASVKVIGLEKLRADVAHLKQEIAEKGLNSAQNAAARVAKYAAITAAPVNSEWETAKGKKISGWLRSTIGIFRQRTKELSMGIDDYDVPSVKVGPSRRGFYGYFLEHGWHPSGPAQEVWMKNPNKTTWLYSKHNVGASWKDPFKAITRRQARGNMQSGAHSQHGIAQGKFIPGTNWFSRAIESSMDAMMRTAEKSLIQVIKRLAA